ncbi:MAG: DUF421 domain-containing protein [Nocardioides sp.]
MWNDLTHLGISAPDKILRTVAVYAALAVLLRLAGKRDLAQLNSFDLVVMLLLSNVVQNAVIGPDNSLTGGLIGAAVLIAVNAVVVRVAGVNHWTRTIFEGTPTTLAHEGRWDEEALHREGLRRADVDAAIRRQNATSVDQTESVVLEAGGALVVTMSAPYQPATRADLDRLEAKLDRLLTPSPGDQD